MHDSLHAVGNKKRSRDKTKKRSARARPPIRTISSHNPALKRAHQPHNHDTTLSTRRAPPQANCSSTVTATTLENTICTNCLVCGVDGGVVDRAPSRYTYTNHHLARGAIQYQVLSRGAGPPARTHPAPVRNSSRAHLRTRRQRLSTATIGLVSSQDDGPGSERHTILFSVRTRQGASFFAAGRVGPPNLRTAAPLETAGRKRT